MFVANPFLILKKESRFPIVPTLQFYKNMKKLNHNTTLDPFIINNGMRSITNARNYGGVVELNKNIMISKTNRHIIHYIPYCDNIMKYPRFHTSYYTLQISKANPNACELYDNNFTIGKANESPF